MLQAAAGAVVKVETNEQATEVPPMAEAAGGDENNKKRENVNMTKTILYTIYISPYIKVTLLTYDNDLYMDIRKDNKHICLNVNQIWQLEMVMHRVTEALEEVKKGNEPWGRFTLPNNVLVTVSPDFVGVDIRKFFYLENSSVPQPTRTGIFLRSDDWEKFKNLLIATGILYPPFFGYTLFCLRYTFN